MDEKRESGKSMLSMRLDDDDDSLVSLILFSSTFSNAFLFAQFYSFRCSSFFKYYHISSDPKFYAYIFVIDSNSFYKSFWFLFILGKSYGSLSFPATNKFLANFVFP